MIIDYSYSTLQQFPLYQGLGNVWTFNGTVAVAVVVPAAGIGIEFRPLDGRLHFRPIDGRLHFGAQEK